MVSDSSVKSKILTSIAFSHKFRLTAALPIHNTFLHDMGGHYDPDIGAAVIPVGGNSYDETENIELLVVEGVESKFNCTLSKCYSNVFLIIYVCRRWDKMQHLDGQCTYYSKCMVRLDAYSYFYLFLQRM